jgi:hypothetical protein
VDGFAEFESVVPLAGKIEVALRRGGSDGEKWSDIIPLIRDGVAARHVFIPEGTRGMRFVVRVEAAMRLPDGKRLRDLGNKTFASSGWGWKDEPGLSSPGVPMVGAVHTGKVCSVGAVTGLLVLGGGCSLENIGSHAARVVRGRVLSESRVD